MSRKKTEKACSAVWKDYSTMSALAKQQTAQEGEAKQGGGDTAHQGAEVLSHDQTAETGSRCHGPLNEEAVCKDEGEDVTVLVCEGNHRTDVTGQAYGTTIVDTESDTGEAGRAIASQSCCQAGHNGQESLTSLLDVRSGSSSVPPIFELECDVNGDDDVFNAGCLGDDEDSDDEAGCESAELSHVTVGSQPVDIPRLTLFPHGSMHASHDTRLIFLPPGGSVPSQHRLAIGTLMYAGGQSISGQSPLGPNNVMVHEALAWTQRLLRPMQQAEDTAARARFMSVNPSQTTNLTMSRDRSQSAPSVMNRSVLEREFGRELRRISDEFHLTYGMGQLRLAQTARRANGRRPASFPCNHGNPHGWWQMIVAYMSPGQPNRHRSCVIDQPPYMSDATDSSLAERDHDEDIDRA